MDRVSHCTGCLAGIHLSTINNKIQYVITTIIRLQNWHGWRHHGEEVDDAKSQFNDSSMFCLRLDSGKNKMVVEIVQTDLTSRRHGVNIKRRSDNTYTESLVNNYHLDERRWEWLLSLSDTYKQGCWRKLYDAFSLIVNLSSFLSYKFLPFYSTVPDSVVTEISSHNIHGDTRLNRRCRTRI